MENVSSEEIREAFSKVMKPSGEVGFATEPDEEAVLTMPDMIQYGLAGVQGSAQKRAALGKILGIGDTNVKQFLHRIGRFSISKEEFLQALKQIEGIGSSTWIK